MPRDYDLITCPGRSCKRGYVGLQICDYCEGRGKIIIPRAKPKRDWMATIDFLLGLISALLVCFGIYAVLKWLL
jgi:hypothetical protein